MALRKSSEERHRSRPRSKSGPGRRGAAAMQAGSSALFGFPTHQSTEHPAASQQGLSAPWAGNSRAGRAAGALGPEEWGRGQGGGRGGRSRGKKRRQRAEARGRGGMAGHGPICRS